jgi:MSHA biogenesis protein MshQ
VLKFTKPIFAACNSIRFLCARHLVAAILLAPLFWGQQAWAANYVFPGTLPPGCSGSGPAYTCISGGTWNSGDTITINSPKPATITINGDLMFNNNLQINSAGTAADLTLIIKGQLRAGPGSRINANVTAKRVDAFSGSVTYGGSLTATVDYVALQGASYVNGSITAKDYVNIGAGTGVAGSITSNNNYVSVGNTSSVNGSIKSTDFTWVGNNAGIGGSIVSGTYATIGSSTWVGGAITTTGNIYINSGSTVNGALTANTGDITLVGGTSGNYSTVGSISTGGNVYLNWYNRVTGNVTGNYVNGGYYNVIGGAVQSGTSPVIFDGHVTVTGNITSTGSYVNINSDGNVGGNITAADYVHIVNNNHLGGTVTALGGAVIIYSNNTFAGDVTASTLVSALDHNTFSGNVTSTTTMWLGTTSSVAKCARSTTPNLMTLLTPSLVHGACCGTAPTCTNTCISGTPKPPSCLGALDHLEIQHASGSGLTCTPSTVTIVACADAACSSYYTGGVTGTLTATGSGMTVNYPSGAGFTIGSGSSFTTVDLQVTKAGSVLLGTSASSTSCNFGSPNCTFTAADSGFIFDVPNHVSNVAQTVSVSAVQKSDSSKACIPAFTSSKSVNFTCAYTNPNTGTLPVLVGGNSTTCKGSDGSDGSVSTVSLSFNASGVASTTVQYADVGQMSLNASYSGSGSSKDLTMTGTDSFIAAPASFAFSGITAAPIAGASFSATVTAKNNSGVATPNFGKETSPESVRLTWSKYQPTGDSAVSGSFSGTGVSPSAALAGFSSGAATVSNLIWTEVGTGDLSAALTDDDKNGYLGSTLTASGSTGSAGAVGPFIPSYFDTVITQACGTFTYSGQPFTVQIQARNAAGNPTLNYDGTANTSPNFAKAVTLSAATNGGTGSLSNSTVAASKFVAGSATVTSTPIFTFTDKLTAATLVSIRATDTDSVSSSTHDEGSVALRSGRIKVSNKYGTKGPLPVLVQTQYWSGKTWVLNSSDSCTALPASAVALSHYLDNQGAGTTAWTTSPSAVSVAGGQGTLTLSAPNPSSTGSVDLAFNLGSSSTDQSCLASHPASTGANLSWLRDRNGTTNACAGVSSYDRDPSARATFGIYSAESKKLIFIREMF